MSRPTEDMTCQEVLDLLEDFLDQDLGRDDAAAVSAHVATCSGCSGELALAERVRSELRRLPETMHRRPSWPETTGLEPFLTHPTKAAI